MKHQNATKNITDLRNALYEQIDLLRAGKAEAATVNAISTASRQVVMSVKLQLEAMKLAGMDVNKAGAIGILPEKSGK